MGTNAKLSIPLTQEELRLLHSLRSRLELKSNVEVIRRGLRLLQEATDRRALKEAYREASRAALILSLLCSACDPASFSEAPVAAACSAIGTRCQLPDGPLGVCQETPCGPGAARPCFKCVSQH